jgi:hypothetical protein
MLSSSLYSREPNVKRNTAAPYRSRNQNVQDTVLPTVVHLLHIGNYNVAIKSPENAVRGKELAHKRSSGSKQKTSVPSRITGTVEAERTRKSSGILRVHMSVSRPKRINLGGLRSRVFIASPSTSRSTALSSLYCVLAREI